MTKADGWLSKTQTHECVTKVGRLSCHTCSEVEYLLQNECILESEEDTIMELITGRNKSNNDEHNMSILRNRNEYESRISKYKKWICITIGFFAVCALTVGLIYGLSIPQNFTSPTAVPSLNWTQICSTTLKDCPSSYEGQEPPLLIISLDGFRTEYLHRGLTPTLAKIQECGTRSEFMFSVFPTKTFPNHYSMVTGLYPSYHGIIDNNMKDPDTGDNFKVGAPGYLDQKWYQEEPIWITAEKQGKKTGTFFWPGSDVTFSGLSPTYTYPYNSSIPFEFRIDQVLEWLDLPVSQRPRFMTLYFDEPDTSGHQFGVYSVQVNESLSRVDGLLERLFLGIQMRNLTDCVNVIIVSDHGMSNTDCQHAFTLQDFIDLDKVDVILGPFARIRPKNSSDEEAIKEDISELNCHNDHVRVYRKEQLPVRMHYSKNPRIEPIYVDVDVGWHVEKSKKNDSGFCQVYGDHGYDDIFPEMKAIFTAIGPSIRKKFSMKPFLNIELYELMCDLIDVTPNPNNGTRGSLYPLLRHPPPLHPQGLSSVTPEIAQPPSSTKEYKARVAASECTCPQVHIQAISDGKSEIERHVLFGFPSYHHDEISEIQLLVNQDYVVSYHTRLQIPLWTSFTLTQNGYFISDSADKDCWTGDSRLPVNETARCYHPATLIKENILQRPLFPPDFSDPERKHEAHFVTNSVAKSISHTENLEKVMNDVLYRLKSEKSALNVVSGPAFDILFSGIRPKNSQLMMYAANHSNILIPTHLFFVATWCSKIVEELHKCEPQSLEVMSFLLPNMPYDQNCELPSTIIEKNFARVADVERLTGISFFTNLPVSEAIRLRTRMPQRIHGEYMGPH